MSRTYFGAALAVAAMLMAPSAFAGALHFDFHDNLGSDNFSFNLPNSTPQPDFSQPDSNAGFFVDGSVRGIAEQFEVYFYNSVYSGGLSADDLAGGGDFYFQNGFGQYDPLTNTYQQVYSGAESAPVFGTGEFILYAQDPDTFESSGIPEGVLTVSNVAAAPEPGTWILMLGALATIGVILRRRRSIEKPISA